MFPIVKQCILNQTHNHWLIFDTLHPAISISVNMQMEIQQSETTSNNFVKEDLESKLQALCLHMMAKMPVVLAPILSFTTTYTPNKAHNMFALMLDTRFKCLDVVKGFVGHVKVMETEYDIKSLMPLLVATFHLQIQVLLTLFFFSE
jgi:hypothetical protein